MIDCKKLIHPFKNDPGTSQRNRIDPELLSGKTAIDNRSLADLLDFFVQLSRHVQYYDENLKINDWQEFFSSSLPFTLAAISKYNTKEAEKKFLTRRKRFLRKTSKAGLYLELRSIFVLFKKIDRWYNQVAGKQTALEPVMEKMMKGKLGTSLKLFITYANAATNKFGTKAIDFTGLAANPVWSLTPSDLTKEDTSYLAAGSTYYKKLLGLYNNIYQLLQTIHDAIKLFSVSAEMGLEQSLIPLQEELKEKHPPHLAIVFAFLKLFKYLQDDLNTFTKKHLDHFYKEVLKLKPKPSQPDHAHLVIEIQKQLDKYLLKKGIAYKDGKDVNKTDIIFTSDDEIVVNKAIVKEQRTLFLQQAPVRFPVKEECRTFSVVEGLYMAPNATMADGIDKPFAEESSRETLGTKWSKYRDPENNFLYPYPNARIGFVMASSVLYLQEGKRKIRITIPCQALNNFCDSLKPEKNVANPCCDDKPLREAGNATVTADQDTCPDTFPSRVFFQLVQNTLQNTYYYINRPIIAALVKKGISKELRKKLEELLMIRYKRPGKANLNAGEKEDPDLCYCGREEYLFETTIISNDYNIKFSSLEQEIMKDLVYPRKAMNVMFSGEKGWVKPEIQNLTIALKNFNAATGDFIMEIISTILPEQDKISFYNAELLKEDLQTELPLVKVEVDDKIKMEIPADTCRQKNTTCCERPFENKIQKVSLYHFFRDVKASAATKIDVEVCGLKEFVVQNDESLQNVNAPVYPFGTRPDVIDFDIKKQPPPLNNLGNLNLIGPNFYIGSREVLLKQWDRICVNIDWKDLPTDFREHYKGYAKQGTKFGLDKDRFLINIAVLEDGVWKRELKHTAPTTTDVTILTQAYHDRLLFDPTSFTICNPVPGQQTIFLKKEFFPLAPRYKLNKNNLDRYEVTTRDGFIRMNLQVQDFCHKEYSYVLARQMMALGKLPKDKIEDAIYYDQFSGDLIVFDTNLIQQDVNNAFTIAGRVQSNVIDPGKIGTRAGVGLGPILPPNAVEIRRILGPFPLGENLSIDVVLLKNEVGKVKNVIDTSDKYQAVIPNEPWTPIMKSISLDYTATATAKNIDLIHLYPYAGTFKPEELEQGAMLFPSFCDEGNFYIGLDALVPGSNLNMLLQFAEATADSESEREKPVWYYLENNRWKLMREGFEILEDATNGLTTSGIVKFSIPGNISKDNTILPGKLHWLRVSVPCKTASVSELIGIHAQAVKVSFTNEEENDKLRLDTPLPAGSISKLQVADSSVSKIQQPYDSFGGRQPEGEGHFYVRISELLRHKNRGIQKFDYERLVLEYFPSVYKTKCINHTYGLNAHEYVNDFTIAPGYVLVAVIPDMNKLKAAGSFEPKVPVSVIEDIELTLRKIISPFVRLKVMNPRYEKINLCIRVKLVEGKDEVYYKEKLNTDIRNFLAPWAIGEFEKLSFGQPVYRSDIIKFLETRDYIDYIIELHMAHDELKMPTLSVAGNVGMVQTITARSILIAGSVDICIDDPGCESWCKCRGEDCCDHELVPIRETEPFIIL